MDLNFIWLFVIFLGMMALGIPVAVSLMISSFAYIWIFNMDFLGPITQAIYAPMSNTLLCMGFFIFAGNLMNTGGVTRKIFDFSKKLCCWIPGGLGHANIVASWIFAGMSGTALADAGGLGKIELQAMHDDGYDDGFSLAVTGASSVLGPVRPPSVPAVMFAAITGISTGRMLMAGMIPSIVAAFAMMVVVYVISIRRNYPKAPFPPLREIWLSFKDSFWELLMPVILLACIYSGVVTPSESATIAGVYAIILGIIHRELLIKDFPRIIRETVELLAMVLFIVAASKVFGYIITFEQVPAKLAQLLMANVTNPTVAFILMAILLVICGALLDNNATILIVTPVLYPVAQSVGIDPVQFGLVFIFVLMIGVITPPVGMVLFVLQGMADVPYTKICKELTPFIVVLFGLTLLFILVPGFSTWLPNLIYGAPLT